MSGLNCLWPYLYLISMHFTRLSKCWQIFYVHMFPNELTGNKKTKKKNGYFCPLMLLALLLQCHLTQISKLFYWWFATECKQSLINLCFTKQVPYKFKPKKKTLNPFWDLFIQIPCWTPELCKSVKSTHYINPTVLLTVSKHRAMCWTRLHVLTGVQNHPCEVCCSPNKRFVSIYLLDLSFRMCVIHLLVWHCCWL